MALGFPHNGYPWAIWHPVHQITGDLVAPSPAGAKLSWLVKPLLWNTPERYRRFLLLVPLAGIDTKNHCITYFTRTKQHVY